jgi:hypothetical protein
MANIWSGFLPSNFYILVVIFFILLYAVFNSRQFNAPAIQGFMYSTVLIQRILNDILAENKLYEANTCVVFSNV